MANIIERKNAPRQGKNAAIDSKGGKFVGAMRKLAQKRSASRSIAPLQVGNVLTKKAPMKGTGSFGSKIDKPEGNQFAPVNATEGQTALNDKQQGASNKKAQKGKGNG